MLTPLLLGAKAAFRFVNHSRQWLVFIAIAAAAAWMYVRFEVMRDDRDQLAAWANATCAAVGEGFAASVRPTATARGKPDLVLIQRGARCGARVAGLAAYERQVAIENARILAQRTHGARIDHRLDGGDDLGRGDAVAAARQYGDEHLPGGGADRGRVADVGMRGAGVEDVSEFGSCDGEAFGREHDAGTQRGVVLEDLRDVEDRVGGRNDKPCDADQRGKVVEVGAGRIGEHDAARTVVEALAQDELAIGADLEQLDHGIGLERRVEAR